MDPQIQIKSSYIAFSQGRKLQQGDLESLLRGLKEALEFDPELNFLIFNQETGRQTDFNFQGTIQDILKRALPVEPKRGRGRPKLGVLSRELSLLPRHWQWLDQQAQGASATVRRLVEEAKKKEPDKAQAKKVREAAGSIMWALAGSYENFEEASRALYASDITSFKKQTERWPVDVKNYLLEKLEEAAQLV